MQCTLCTVLCKLYWSLSSVFTVCFSDHLVVCALCAVELDHWVGCTLCTVQTELWTFLNVLRTQTVWLSVCCVVDQVHYFSVQCELNSVLVKVYNSVCTKQCTLGSICTLWPVEWDDQWSPATSGATWSVKFAGKKLITGRQVSYIRDHRGWTIFSRQVVGFSWETFICF